MLSKWVNSPSGFVTGLRYVLQRSKASLLDGGLAPCLWEVGLSLFLMKTLMCQIPFGPQEILLARKINKTTAVEMWPIHIPEIYNLASNDMCENG